MSRKMVWIISGALISAPILSVPPRSYSTKQTLYELAGRISSPSVPTVSLQLMNFRLFNNNMCFFNASHLPININ